MPEGVVDRLEAVEVHPDEGEARPSAAKVDRRLIEPLAKQGSVAEPGERIVARHVFRRFLRRLASRTIANGGDIAARRAGFIAKQAKPAFHPDERAVFPPEALPAGRAFDFAALDPAE